MQSKNLEIIQGDTLNLDFEVMSQNGQIDFSKPGTRLYAQVSELSGRRVLASMKVIPINMAEGKFRIFLDSATSNKIRGKNLWAVRYEIGEQTMTLAGGTLTVQIGA